MASRRYRWALCAVLASAVSLPHAARAVSDEERAGARSAANLGADAFDQGKWAEAVELFSRAEALVHSPIHLSYIAQAELKLGHWVKAYEIFNRVQRETPAAGAPKAFTDAIATAQREAAKLEGQLPYVTVTVKGGEGKTVSVTMDGAPMSSALISVPHPVDPGTHKFLASAPPFTSDELVFEAKPAGRQTLELVLHMPAGAVAPVAAPVAPAPGAPLAPAPAPAPGAAPPQPAPAPGAPLALSSDGANSGKGMRIGGYVALGVGVVGLGAGTLFLLQGKSKQSDADTAFQACGGRICPVAQRSSIDQLDSDAASARTLSNIGFIAGGVGIAAGITLLVLAGKHKEGEQSAHVQAWVGSKSAGLSGTF